MAEKPVRAARDVFTLVVQVGRKPGDGLPEGATGAALMCFSVGRDEAEAVREAVAVLKEAGLAPLDVTAYGTPAERRQAGQPPDAEEEALMQRARDENAVIVVQSTPFYD